MKLSRTVILFFLTALAFSGCERRAPADAASNNAVPGAAAPGAAPLRIISAAPSNTEIIVGLGLADRVIAADKYSLDLLPPGITEIDFFYPDAEAILGLAPDLIISSEHNVYGAADDPYKILGDMGINILYIPTSRSIADIKRDIRTVAAALGEAGRGEDLVRTMEQEIQELAEIGQRITADPAFKRKTVYLEISPFPNPVTMGRETFLDEMLGIIGARNVFGDTAGWIAPSAEAILERNPELILTNVNFIEDPVGEIKSRQGFASITAIRENQVHIIDTDSSSRPSHRITVALRQMAQAVYPEEYAR
ncbi:MAG: ABC transporter substrate-binding protein [Treponema sp.]|jgi:iron complex transport system substrate-binding protein|nr:ABC transporter substrate-binding protein [Treponema sp.]